jgi:protein O-mannosyl-transferase
MPTPALESNSAPTSTPASGRAAPRLPAWVAAIFLVLVTLALYRQATGFDFINYDDPYFVISNIHAQRGLNWEGVKWAFGLNGGDYWHPVTWLSFMLDASLFGQWAGGYHFTNVALHAANGGLVFLLLWMLTGAFWRSVVVAALFALHPLRVESVAWVTERKDVLSGCFGLLALIFYARYAQRTVVRGPWSIWYLLSLFFFASGLMSKAMLVTWPFVMLLLDYWPLGRMERGEGRRQKTADRGQEAEAINSQHATSSATQLAIGKGQSQILFPLLVEKIPFFVLSGVSCLLTYLTEPRKSEATGFADSPALLRLENALVAYAHYLGKTFWPVKLAVPYMNPGHWSWLEVGGSVLVVVGVSLVALWLGRRFPYLLVGWCWFWGTLIPVIGLTKGWGSFMADRFTYMPSVGVLILVVWGGHEMTRKWRYQLQALWVVGGAVIVVCVALTWQQLGYWKDSETLLQHVLEVTENNAVAHCLLGAALEERGQIDEAIKHLREAIHLSPRYADAYNNLGVALDRKGQIDEAIKQLMEALRLRPDYADAYYNLGVALAQKGQTDEAIRQYRQSLRLDPNNEQAHSSLGRALGQKGETDEAIRHFQEALRLKPDDAEAHYNLAIALGQKGQTDEAIRQYQQTLRLKPDDADAHYNLGVVLGETGQIGEAIRQFQEALRLKPDDADAHYNLGIALNQTGQIDEAIHQFQETVRLRPDYADARKKLDVALAVKAQSSPAARSSNKR